MIEEIINVKDICLSFNKKRILNNINVEFSRGEAVLIAGKNGSGKSTFLKCLGGVLFPDSGSIKTSMSNKKRVGFISDKMSLLENYTLDEGVNFHCGIFEIPDFNYSLLNELKLNRNKKIKHLSTGERAIYHLSLLLSQKPEVLLVDEIIHTIDPYMRELFLETMIDLIDDLSTTIIMVNHTFSDTGRIPERILLMEEGQFILDEKRENLNNKIRKVVTETEIKGDIPVIFKKESSICREYYIFPFSEEFNSKFEYDFLQIELTEIIKAFIGGYYDKKRV